MPGPLHGGRLVGDQLFGLNGLLEGMAQHAEPKHLRGEGMPQSLARLGGDDPAIVPGPFHGVPNRRGQQAAHRFVFQRPDQFLEIGASHAGPGRVVDQYPVVLTGVQAEIGQGVEH